MERNESLKIPVFTDTEKEYKKIFEQYPNANLNRAKSIQEIHSLVPELMDLLDAPELLRLLPPQDFRYAANNLQECYFPVDLDVLIIPALRYAPAFLHSHSFFEVICVLNGECDNIFSSNTLHMKAGEICIVAPETVHALSVFSDDCIVYNLIIRSATFESTFLDALPKDSILYLFFTKSLYQSGEKSCLYFKKPQDAHLQKLILEMHHEMKQQRRYYGTMLNAMLTTFFIHLLRKYEKDVVFPNAQHKKYEENLIFILKYIENNYKTITLKELSNFFGYSERQMIRILKTYTGENFTSLIRSAKLSKACELLKHPDIRLSDIISEVGYSNASHFYDSFRKKYGQTPAEYRQQHAHSLFHVNE